MVLMVCACICVTICPCATAQWLGTDIHVAHHERAFYHVSIDSMSLVVPWFIAAASLFYVRYVLF